MAATAVLGSAAFASGVTSGTWSSLNNSCPFGAGTCLLLTDGRVLVHDDNGGTSWAILTPDSTGSYINGTWSTAGSLPNDYGPLYFASDVLPDGRVVIMGGEYNFGANTETNLCAVYNPTTNTWAHFNAPSGVTQIGDAMSLVLPNGKVMMANQFGYNSYLLDPSTLTWTSSAYGSGKNDPHSEEGWTLLPGGNILTLDCTNTNHTELFDGTALTWSDAGSTANTLPSNTGYPAIVPEMGPGVLRPDGSVFEIGASGFTAVRSSGGTWSNGPTLGLDGGNQLDAADGPASVLPDGNVFFVASPTLFNPHLHCYEFDGTNATEVANEPFNAGDSSYYCRTLTLPTGQVLFTDGGAAFIYTPVGSAQPSWQPTISTSPSTVVQGTTGYSVSGTQFNGLTQCNFYGDDNQQASNYPLVRIVNNTTNHVFYCKTHDHSTMGVATGATSVSTSFDVPVGVESGASTLYVVANGIASTGTPITVQPTVSSVGLSPSEIVAGNANSTATVTLNANAVGDQTITLATSNVDTTVPASVKVTDGTNSATFVISAAGVASQETATITATYGGVSKTTVLTFDPATIATLKVLNSSVQGGFNNIGEVILQGKAKPGGSVVSLQSNSANVNVPSTIAVPEQTDYVYFYFSTSSVTASETDTISATYGGTTLQKSVTVTPPVITNFAMTHSSVVGGQSVYGVVDINAKATAPGVQVSLQTSSSDTQLPLAPAHSVTIPAGSSYAYFLIGTSVVSAQESVTITGGLGTQSPTTTLTLNPAPIAQVKFTNSSIHGGSATMGEVVLNGKAGPGGDVVSLSSDNAAATVPSTVTVPAGQNYVYFRIPTTAVGSATQVHITASLTPTSQQGTLTLNP